ncbi:MAG TPA: hypothetical protein VJ909_06430 [Prolixibacteraceae bacterium]|nr:hypothetical protein [Prolixibacteraceae bacterium]
MKKYKNQNVFLFFAALKLFSINFHKRLMNQTVAWGNLQPSIGKDITKNGVESCESGIPP